MTTPTTPRRQDRQRRRRRRRPGPPARITGTARRRDVAAAARAGGAAGCAYRGGVETLRLYGGWTPRFVVLYTPALFTALALFMIAMFAWLSTIWWPMWLSVSLGLGVAGGCLYLMRGWWAGALRAAKAGGRGPYLALAADELVIHQAMLFDEPVRIPRAHVAAVAVDTTGKRHWWTDVRRFPVFEGPRPGEPGERGGD